LQDEEEEEEEEAKRRRRNEWRANVMKVEGIVDDGRREHKASSESRRR